MNIREAVKDKKRIVIKIGSSSLMHNETGRLNLGKIEKLVRTIVDIKNSGKDVVLVSSGAIAVGRMAIGLNEKPDELPVKQAHREDYGYVRTVHPCLLSGHGYRSGFLP